MMSKKYFQMIALSTVICSISYGSPIWAGSEPATEEACTKKILGLTCKSLGCTWLPKAVGNLKKGCHNSQLALEEHGACITNCGDNIIDACLKTCTKTFNECHELCRPKGDDCYINKCGLATSDPLLYRNSPNKLTTKTKEDCEKQHGRPCRDVCNKKYLDSKKRAGRTKEEITKEETDFTNCKKECATNLGNCLK